jgi:hypothetical protein
LDVVLTAQMVGEPLKNIMVDVDGNFSDQLTEGEYVLNVSAVGYTPQTLNVTCKLTGLKRVSFRLVKV